MALVVHPDLLDWVKKGVESKLGNFVSQRGHKAWTVYISWPSTENYDTRCHDCCTFYANPRLVQVFWSNFIWMNPLYAQDTAEGCDETLAFFRIGPISQTNLHRAESKTCSQGPSRSTRERSTEVVAILQNGCKHFFFCQWHFKFLQIHFFFRKASLETFHPHRRFLSVSDFVFFEIIRQTHI